MTACVLQTSWLSLVHTPQEDGTLTAVLELFRATYLIPPEREVMVKVIVAFPAAEKELGLIETEDRAEAVWASGATASRVAMLTGFLAQPARSRREARRARFTRRDPS